MLLLYPPHVPFKSCLASPLPNFSSPALPCAGVAVSAGWLATFRASLLWASFANLAATKLLQRVRLSYSCTPPPYNTCPTIPMLYNA